MAELEDVVAELQSLRSLVRLAFSTEIERTIARFQEDEVVRSVMAEASDWIESTRLQELVAGATGKSTRTVRDRIASLADVGLLATDGGGRPIRYRVVRI